MINDDSNSTVWIRKEVYNKEKEKERRKDVDRSIYHGLLSSLPGFIVCGMQDFTLQSCYKTAFCQGWGAVSSGPEAGQKQDLLVQQHQLIIYNQLGKANTA